MLIEHFLTVTTARCVADLIGVKRNPKAFYFLTLREIILHELGRESDKILGSTIDLDESYLGGARKGQQAIPYCPSFSIRKAKK